MSGKWWLLRAGGAGEPGEAAEGHGAAGKVHLSRTRQKKWAKIGPLSPFSSCPRISQSGQGARAALWAALWPDSGRPSAGPGRPFGPPLVLRGGPKGRPGRPGGPAGRPSGRPFFEGRPERRPFFCKGRPHFEGGRPAATRAAPPATMGGPSAQRRPHSGRPQFEGGRPEGGPAAQARRPGRPIGPPDFRGWPPTFGWRAARFWSEGRPIWRLGGPGGGRAARSPLTADSTTYRTPVPTSSLVRLFIYGFVSFERVSIWD